jgi:hypothetical protein
MKFLYLFTIALTFGAKLLSADSVLDAGNRSLDTLKSYLKKPTFIYIRPGFNRNTTKAQLAKERFVKLTIEEHKIFVDFISAPDEFGRSKTPCSSFLHCLWRGPLGFSCTPVVLCAVGQDATQFVLRLYTGDPKLPTVDAIYRDPSFLQWIESRRIKQM